ncbi:hypothetical protein [Chryseobacterium arthrosphaerae]|uniref:hypothetical protein n=1 Tax=Chryseobacterium arthrosphaerae TaxID=651561 RepID=UPI0031E2244C
MSDQVNITVTDLIPPANIATVDSGNVNGNTYNKAQLDEWKTNVQKNATGGIKGEATPSSSPTPWATGQPDLFEKWEVKTAGVYTNFKDSGGTAIEVTAGEVAKSLVQLWVTNNVSKKVVTDLPSNPADNLIDERTATIGYVGSTGSLNDTNTDYRKVRIDNLKSETNYHLSALSDYFHPSQSKNLVFFDSTGAFISRLAVTGKIFPFTTPTNTSHAYMNVYVADDGDDLAQLGNYQLALFEGDFKKDQVKLTSYSALKSVVSASGLIPGDEITVMAGDASFRTTAISKNKISENIIVDGYDFGKLDITNDRVLAIDTLSCVARNSGGVWGFVEDSDHTQKGIVSIENSTNSFRINYAKNYSKILALTVVTDETYAKYGISVGSSVGNGYSQVFFYGNRVDGVIGNNLTVENAGYLSGFSAVSQSSGTVTVTHAEITDSIPVITLNQPYNVKIVSFNDASFTFELYNSGTKITDFSNVKVNFVRTGSRSLTNTEMAISSSNFWIQAIMENQIDL